MTNLRQDLRGAVRSLSKTPGFALVSILTLSLAIGATTAIFTVVKSVLLEPLPFPEAHRVVLVQSTNPEAGFPRFALSSLNFRDYRAMSTSFEAFAARTGSGLALTGIEGGARQLSGRSVTSEFLRATGIPPARGRDFTEQDDVAGAPPTIILSHALWQDLGGTDDVLGNELMIDGEKTAIIGILPAGEYHGIDAIVPLRHDYAASNRGAHWLIGFARLKKGVDIEQARAELETIAAGLQATYPDSNTGWSTIVDPLKERVVENVETALWILLGAVGLVLLIACANVANLTLARTARREREIALRSALGAGRWSLVRRLLTESLVIGLAAAALGAALAHFATRALVTMNADRLPRVEDVAVDGGVLLFGLILSLGTAILIGLVPAIQATGVAPSAALKEGGRGQAGGARGQRLRRGLVLAEVALALVVLVGAGLLMRSFASLVAVDPGFRPDGLWTASFSLPDGAYGEEPARIDLVARLLEEGAGVPGIESLATIFPMPLSGNDWINDFYREGQPLPGPNESTSMNVAFASPGYFETVGIPLRQGRTFTSADRGDDAPVVMINESAVKRYWGDRDAVGTRISFGRPDSETVRWYEVVGIVGDVHLSALDSTLEPTVYRSALQDLPQFATIVARGTGEPGALAGSLRQLVARLDPNLPLANQQAAQTIVDDSLAAPRMNTVLLATFAALALVLAAIGVFSVVTYGVTQRLRELGVRMALGAEARQILSLVLRQGMTPVLAGIVIGLLAAAGASRLLESMVYGVGTGDPAAFAVGGGLLFAVAVVACLVPALRATRVDPLRVLRDE